MHLQGITMNLYKLIPCFFFLTIKYILESVTNIKSVFQTRPKISLYFGTVNFVECRCKVGTPCCAIYVLHLLHQVIKWKKDARIEHGMFHTLAGCFLFASFFSLHRQAQPGMQPHFQFLIYINIKGPGQTTLFGNFYSISHFFFQYLHSR